jgi:two-component system, OmpR family, KDP operon response regulator KdpE
MNASNGTVLLVEDDYSLRRTLNTALSALGFEIGEAGTGEEALRRLLMIDYEVVLLDMNLPGLDGIETCRRIRRSFTRLPILMLTVRDFENDKVQAFESGADDYITKPFQVRELTARIRSAVRRYRATDCPPEEPVVIGQMKLDVARRTVEKAGLLVRLTRLEFKALQLLMENAGKPLTYDKLSTSLWGAEAGERRENLRVLISNLRGKLEQDPVNPEYLVTESCIGYRFREG